MNRGRSEIGQCKSRRQSNYLHASVGSLVNETMDLGAFESWIEAAVNLAFAIAVERGAFPDSKISDMVSAPRVDGDEIAAAEPVRGTIKLLGSSLLKRCIYCWHALSAGEYGAKYGENSGFLRRAVVARNKANRFRPHGQWKIHAGEAPRVGVRRANHF
jgi:hypothetical protein